MRVGLNELAEKIRNGLFMAASRTYGEQYIEPFVRAHYGLDSPSSDDHDGVHPSTGDRYEIKAAKVLTSRIVSAKRSLIERILAEGTNTALHRMVPYANRYSAEYAANIQNVKRAHFDFLIYVLLFSDRVTVFKVGAKDISNPNVPNWSDKHGRYDQHGMSGQFSINKNSLRSHEERFLQVVLTYEDLSERYKSL
jgi:hypothetical protein